MDVFIKGVEWAVTALVSVLLLAGLNWIRDWELRRKAAKLRPKHGAASSASDTEQPR